METRFKYISLNELKCKCGKCKLQINLDFADKLNVAREYAGVPFSINSGCRCPEHNTKEGGSITSSHLKCIAADISCSDDSSRLKIVMGLIKAGFTRIGISKSFIHVDCDPDKSACMWVY